MEVSCKFLEQPSRAKIKLFADTMVWTGLCQPYLLISFEYERRDCSIALGTDASRFVRQSIDRNCVGARLNLYNWQ